MAVASLVIDAKGDPLARAGRPGNGGMGAWPGYVRLFGIAYGAVVTGQQYVQWEPLRALPDDELLRQWRRLTEAAIPSSAEAVAGLRTTV